jgi:hypothetical protein
VAKQVVRLWAQDHCDLPDTNPVGWRNVLAYFSAVVQTEVQKMSELAQQQMQVKMAGAPPQPTKPQIPPDEINDIVNTTAGLMHLPPSATGDNVQGQVQAANTLIKLADKLMQDGAA